MSEDNSDPWSTYPSTYDQRPTNNDDPGAIFVWDDPEDCFGTVGVTAFASITNQFGFPILTLVASFSLFVLQRLVLMSAIVLFWASRRCKAVHNLIHKNNTHVPKSLAAPASTSWIPPDPYFAHARPRTAKLLRRSPQWQPLPPRAKRVPSHPLGHRVY